MRLLLIFLKFLFTWFYVIRIILWTFEKRLKTLHRCFWYFKKRRGDSFSSDVAFILHMTCNKVFEFLVAVSVTITIGFGFLKKIKSLNAFLKLITHLIALQSKYAKLEMKMQLAIFLKKCRALWNFSWTGERTIASAQLTSEYYRQSPILQGGMEIACKVTVKIPGTCVNILLMEKYKQLVQQLYIEPKNKEILEWRNEAMDGVEAQPVSKKAKVKRKKPIRKLTNKKTYAIFLRNK